jgi:magnesium-transporting ATPase (P-type)
MGESIRIDADRHSDHFLDSPNVAFLGYQCVGGECTGVVIATGKACLISKLIAQKAWPPSEF